MTVSYYMMFCNIALKIAYYAKHVMQGMPFKKLRYLHGLMATVSKPLAMLGW